MNSYPFLRPISSYDDFLALKQLQMEQEIYKEGVVDYQVRESIEKKTYEFTVCSLNIWCPFWNVSDPQGVESSFPEKWI